MDKTEARLKKLEEQKRDIEAKMQQIRARQQASERKIDTRKKVLLGAYLMSKMEDDEAMRDEVLRDLDGFLVRENDRKVFGFLPKKEAGNGF